MAIKKLWRYEKSKLLIRRGSAIMNCTKCPCSCEPFIVVEWISNSNGSQGTHKCFNLRPYQGDGVGIPGAKWRLVETGACLKYGNGDVNENGKLVGLRDEFCSNYSYNGYMKLQIGCPQQNGTIKWATRCS